jgi:hypothetical protein
MPLDLRTAGHEDHDYPVPKLMLRLVEYGRPLDDFDGLIGQPGQSPRFDRTSGRAEDASAGDQCVRECERDHQVLSGEWAGAGSRPWRRLSRAPLARER